MTEDARSLSEEIADLKTADEPRRGPVEARKKAMDLLARREHARGELLAKLEKAGFEAGIALDAVLALEAENLQSDARFAEAFVRSRFNQGKGPVRIRQELRERDVAAAVIDDAFTEFGADWQALARETRERKFGPEVPREFKEKARQMRFLQYRGFEQDQITSAVGDA